ncbi:MAG: C-terminal helicase domain-containing protein, partial [Bacillota bacterium]|nr:C-terminal helicase domain-containing protein [Bacillota bacterium]
FNSGTTPVFLISLKAGGTGLNLTGADVVIHFDPWWNPAVENQATDRAHRIGQKKTVEVIKLIARDSIEEKIYNLQEKKREVFDKVIDDGEKAEGMLVRMSAEDIMEILK